TGSNNTIDTTTGTALNVATTNINSGGLTFLHLSASGGTNGIVLNNTGTGAGNGGLTVTGTGSTNGSGGTISNTTGDSINLSSTKAISLANMTITDAGNNVVTNDNSNWIDATTVTGLTLTNMHATGSVGTGVKGDSLTNLIVSGGVFNGGGLDNDQANFHGFDIHNLLGTSSVTGATFSHSNTIQFHVNNDTATNFAGTPDQLTVSGTTWNLHTDPFAGDHLSVNSDTGGNFKLIVNNTSGQNTFTTGGTAVQATAGGTNGKMTADISGVTSGGTLASGNNNTAMAVIGETGSGSITYDIHNNTSLGTGSVAIKVTHASAGGTSTGKIDNNTITHVAGPGTDAIGVDVDGVGATGGTGTLSIFNNSITGNYQRGILVQSGEHGVINATIHDNSLFGTDTTGVGLQHISVVSGISGGVPATMRLNMFNNIVDQAASATYTADYRLNNMTNSTYQLQDFVGNGSTVSDIQAWVLTTKANQANGTGTVTVNINSPFSASAGPIPTAPLLAAHGQGLEGGLPLTEDMLVPIVAAALQHWVDAGLTDSQMALLDGFNVHVGDLADGVLGLTSGSDITIDMDGAGWGWFVDSTPLQSEEFDQVHSATEVAASSGDASGHMDLLTVVEHELGHALGLDHSPVPGDVMDGTLDVGERRVPDAADVAEASASGAMEAEAALPASAQAADGTPIIVGTAGNDTINAGHGGNVLFGGAGTDKFVFGPDIQPNAPTPAQLTHVADYHAAEGDTFDFSALTSQFHNSGANDAAIIRAVEDSSGKFATLQVDHIDPMGLPSAPNWVNVAQLDGAHAGDSVNVLIDNHSVHLAQIHVDLLV
ncbi:MAG TPA: matrixin family metalloprotease, partial [Bradyrhizobium sp.]|nr:matrixin family metalloprotease [Bradyrhizobium sp.]